MFILRIFTSDNSDTDAVSNGDIPESYIYKR